MSSIVTGEAVVLELRPASFAARGLGVLIDITAQGLVLIGVIYLLSQVAPSLDEAAGRALVLAILVLVLLIGPVMVETLSRGKSLGKLVMGLRIVRDDGGSIRFRQAFIRGLLAIFELYMMVGSVAFLASIFNERFKRLGDMLAGTYSLRERIAPTPPVQAYIDPALRSWTRLADIGRLPDALARRISQFIDAAPRMALASRQQLAVALADEAGAFVSPSPPHGTGPDAFLNALMAERRNRDFAILTIRRERAEQLAQRLHRLPFER